MQRGVEGGNQHPNGNIGIKSLIFFDALHVRTEVAQNGHPGKELASTPRTWVPLAADDASDAASCDAAVSRSDMIVGGGLGAAVGAVVGAVGAAVGAAVDALGEPVTPGHKPVVTL